MNSSCTPSPPSRESRASENVGGYAHGATPNFLLRRGLDATAFALDGAGTWGMSTRLRLPADLGASLAGSLYAVLQSAPNLVGGTRSQPDTCEIPAFSLLAARISFSAMSGQSNTIIPLFSSSVLSYVGNDPRGALRHWAVLVRLYIYFMKSQRLNKT